MHSDRKQLKQTEMIVKKLKIIQENVKPNVVKSVQVLRNFFIEFCDNCSIHGIRYISERGIHWSERCLIHNFHTFEC